MDVTYGLLPLACTTAVALFVLRHWLAQHQARTTQAVQTLVTAHKIKQDELTDRERAVIKAERLLTRTKEVADLRARGIVDRLDMVNNENAHLRLKCESLENELGELTNEYNEAVAEVLQQRSYAFTRRLPKAATVISSEHTRPLEQPVPIGAHRPRKDALPAPMGAPNAGPVQQRSRTRGQDS
ncbi:hypothetical protein [Streptomyces sp. AD55]|uniref:hypothetical protein n=1 Tax=Streptomyces sp. AD55 TaxID=3242895 RepID=UPI00352866A6